MSLVEPSLVPLVGGAVVIASFAGLGYLVQRAAGAREACGTPEATATGLGVLILAGEPWYDRQLSVVATDAFSENPWNDSAVRVSLKVRGALRRLLPAADASFRDEKYVVIPVGAP